MADSMRSMRVFCRRTPPSGGEPGSLVMGQAGLTMPSFCMRE